ncbi:TPA: hypothetical protein BOS_14966 [Bos taurus]|nr:TPA: hypothetical protein BOS_14966 [Bos taurus]
MCLLQGSKLHTLLIECVLQPHLQLRLGGLLQGKVSLGPAPLLGQPRHLPLLLPTLLLLLPLALHQRGPKPLQLATHLLSLTLHSLQRGLRAAERASLLLFQPLRLSVSCPGRLLEQLWGGRLWLPTCLAHQGLQAGHLLAGGRHLLLQGGKVGGELLGPALLLLDLL